MNIEKTDWVIEMKSKVGVLSYRIKRKLGRWFPKEYAFRVIRMQVVIEQKGEDYLTPEQYDIIALWNNEHRRFGKQILQGNHSLELPAHADNGWTFFTYELQRRPDENWDARWKSLGYLRFNRTS